MILSLAWAIDGGVMSGFTRPSTKTAFKDWWGQAFPFLVFSLFVGLWKVLFDESVFLRYTIQRIIQKCYLALSWWWLYLGSRIRVRCEPDSSGYWNILIQVDIEMFWFKWIFKYDQTGTLGLSNQDRSHPLFNKDQQNQIICQQKSTCKDIL